MGERVFILPIFGSEQEEFVRSGWLLISTLWFSALLVSPAQSEPCTSSSTCRDTLTLSTGKTIPYYHSYPLVQNDAIEQAVIVVHGNLRDADRYYERLVAAASADGRLHDTLLLAPNFRTKDDGPGANEHYWSSGGWKIGHKSRDKPGRISSFEVMNELLERVCSTSIFPRIRMVVIIGHSAGGQFVNRYAAGGKGCPDPGVNVRYVVMNPSSYLYLTGVRASDFGGFETPDSCPEYDDYKYGLNDLNTYMKSVGATSIRSNLFTRQTYYLAGEEDTSTSGSLDVSCSGNLQGVNRLQRFRNYRQYANLFDLWADSIFLSVPGIGHSGRKMLMSETTRSITFRSNSDTLPSASPLQPTHLSIDAVPAP